MCSCLESPAEVLTVTSGKPAGNVEERERERDGERWRERERERDKEREGKRERG